MTSSKEKILSFIDNLSHRKEYLPHSSQSKAKTDIISRNIFAARFIFRGLFYQLLLQESEDIIIAQKALKKFFSADHLSKLYVELIESHYKKTHSTEHHQTTPENIILSLIGWITLNNEAVLYLFMDWAYKALSISDNNLSTVSQKELWHKIQYFAGKHYDFTSSVSTVKKENVYYTEIWINPQKSISVENEKFKMSRYLAFRKCIGYFTELEENLLMEKEEYLLLKQKKQEEKEKKLQERKIKARQRHENYMKEREEKRKARKKKFMFSKQEKYKIRLKSRMRKAKQRRLTRERAEEYERKLRNATGQKRRILEDRGILPKK